MRKFLFIIFIFYLASFNSYCQWEPCNNGLDKVGNINSIAVNGNNIFAGSEIKGIYVSTNYGDTWTQQNGGLPITGVNSIVVINNNVIAGTNSNGIYKSTNNGTTWFQTNVGLTCNNITELTIDGTTIYAGTTNGIFVSTNDGGIWSDISSGLVKKNVISLAVTGNNIYAAINGEGLYLSTDNGKNWTKVEVDAGKNFTNISSLAVSDGNIFAGFEGCGLYASTNNGNDWYCFFPTSESKYCFGVSGFNVFAGSNKSLILTKNNGLYWQDIRGNISALFVITCLAISDKYIFAGAGNGTVFRTNVYNYINLSLGKINDVIMKQDTSIIINLPIIVYDFFSMKLTVITDNELLLAPDSLKAKINETEHFMRITPAKRHSGEANITLKFKYGGDSASTTFKVTVTKSASVDDLNFNEEISIYPNPAESRLSIITNNEFPLGKIEIYNLLGTKVHSIDEQKNRTEIDISLFPTGVYFIKFSKLQKIFVKN